jgi:hypothetical protein
MSYQIPSEKRVVPIPDKAYPFQEYAEATPHQLLHAAVEMAVKDKHLEKPKPSYSLEEFSLLMKSRSICIWGECFSTKRRMKN